MVYIRGEMSHLTYISAPPVCKYKSSHSPSIISLLTPTLSPSPLPFLTPSPFFTSQGVIWTIWRMRTGRRASTMSMASSRPSSSPSRPRPPLAMATASSQTSVQWAPCCCCYKLYWARWSTPSWWAPEPGHDWEMAKREDEKTSLSSCKQNDQIHYRNFFWLKPYPLSSGRHLRFLALQKMFPNRIL